MTSDDAVERAELALQRARAFHDPDPRVGPFEVDVSHGTDAIHLVGTVTTRDVRSGLLAEVRSSVHGSVTADVAVLDDIAAPHTVGRSVLPVRDEPDDGAEQVTQVLYGDRIAAYGPADGPDGWRRIRAPDGYYGWVHADAVATVAERFATAGDRLGGSAAPDGVVVQDIETDRRTLHVGTDCYLEAAPDDGTVVIRFRTGETATVTAAGIRRLPTEFDTVVARDAVIGAARRFYEAETPYEWGGMTVDGIDCSGLVCVAYATVGLRLPRDADQQGTMGTPVSRADLLPGDLLIFPGHVAISLGGDTFLHAYGSAERVTIGSLDPSDDRYEERLDETMTDARRLIRDRS